MDYGCGALAGENMSLETTSPLGLRDPVLGLVLGPSHLACE